MNDFSTNKKNISKEPTPTSGNNKSNKLKKDFKLKFNFISKIGNNLDKVVSKLLEKVTEKEKKEEENFSFAIVDEEIKKQKENFKARLEQRRREKIAHSSSNLVENLEAESKRRRTSYYLSSISELSLAHVKSQGSLKQIRLEEEISEDKENEGLTSARTKKTDKTEKSGENTNNTNKSHLERENDNIETILEDEDDSFEKFEMEKNKEIEDVFCVGGDMRNNFLFNALNPIEPSDKPKSNKDVRGAILRLNEDVIKIRKN